MGGRREAAAGVGAVATRSEASLMAGTRSGTCWNSSRTTGRPRSDRTKPWGVVGGRRLGGRVVEGEVAHVQLGGDGAGQSGLAGLPGAGQVEDPELSEHVADEGVEVSGVHGVVGER